MKNAIPFVVENRVFSENRSLTVAARSCTCVCAVIMFGLIHAHAQSQPASTPAFEVASIKPNHGAVQGMGIRLAPGGRFMATNLTAKFLIEYAYNVKDPQLSGGPGWINSERYDIDAKPEDSPEQDLRKLSRDQQDERLRLMVQSLLADRFKLTVRRETKELPIYALVVAKNGPKLQKSKIQDSDAHEGSGPGGLKRGRMARMGRGQLTMNGVPLAMLADALSRQLGRNVLDKTGLTGVYDLTLQWMPDESQSQMFKGPGDGGDAKATTDSAPPPDVSGPSIFTALQEQLGLKLESQKGPVETFVIDHVEKPSEN